tara:strand:- start:380 stop:1765 length:1386 start_codon:yes stop_codon:yes gene_type:complete
MSEDIKNQDEVTEASMAKPPVANKGVVTPDKDPVPKSLASVDKASDGTKPSAKRKGDQDKKDSPQKLKAGMQYNETENEEEVVVEDMTKMEALRKIIEELKGFDKEDIQSLVNEMMKKKDDEDEDDEDDEKSESTKADLLKKIAEHFKSEDEEVVKESLTAILEASKEDDEEDEDEDEQKDEMNMPKKKKGEKSEASEDDDEDDEDEDEDEKSESYDMSDDIDALVGGEDLSEEFRNKAKVVFEAAVNAKVSEIKEELESQKRDEVVEASNELKEELIGKVDSFLGYVAEEWVKDNELAIERGLKSELTENFIQGLKALFEDHYVEVPDDKLDVVDELASKIEEVEAKLNEEVSKNIDLSQERDELVRNKVVSEVSKDLTESEVEKLSKLIEDLDQDEDFESNVQTIKESYFSDSKEKLQLDEQVVSDSEQNTSTEDKILDPSMAAYSAAIGKLDPNKYNK